MPPDIDLLEAPSTPATPAAPPEGSGRESAPASPAKTDVTPSPAAPKEKSVSEPKARGGKQAKTEKATPAEAAAKPLIEAPAADAADADGEDDPLGFDKETEGDAKPQATWPEDWRDKIAGDDPKFLAELKRFTSFEAYAKSTKALRAKLSSGEYKRASLPENATDAEKAEWRKENGIPDKVEDYGLPEIKGHEWSDLDKGIATDFLSDLHAAGTPKPQAEAALKWYAKFQQQQAQARSDRDRQDAQEREDALRTEWGPQDYRPHIKLAKDTFQDDEFMPPDLRNALAGARTADGRRLILHPEFTRFLAERGLERRGPAGLISGEQGARMGGRIDEIKKIMNTDLDRYYAEGLDKELLELTEKVESGRSR